MSEYSMETMIILDVFRYSNECRQINEWANDNNVIISAHAFNEPSINDLDRFVRGTRFIIENEDQVVLFLLRWGHLVIDNQHIK